jgi:hypothetical protein
MHRQKHIKYWKKINKIFFLSIIIFIDSETIKKTKLPNNIKNSPIYCFGVSPIFQIYIVLVKIPELNLILLTPSRSQDSIINCSFSSLPLKMIVNEKIAKLGIRM